MGSGQHGGISGWEDPTGSHSVSDPLFLDIPQAWGEQGWEKKGNKVLQREVNHKLGRGTQFWGTQGQGEIEIVRGSCVANTLLYFSSYHLT